MAKKVLTGFTADVDNIQALADQPVQSAATLKAIFDDAGNEVKADGNTLVAELQDSTLNDSGGHAIGLGIAGVTADNVAEGIKEVYDAIAGIALGAIPDNSITAAKMANDMDKGVAGGVEAFNDALTHKQSHINHIHYAAASGSANVYAVTLDASVVALTEGFAVAFKPSATNSGASTLNVNSLGAVSIKTPSGANVAAGQLVLGNIYTLRYNGTNFILQGEGAIGNAVAADLLSGKIATTAAGSITGSMVDRGTVNITPSTVNQTILGGKHSGSGVVYGSANLLASNIKYPVELFGLTGTYKGITPTAGGLFTLVDRGDWSIDTSINSASDWTGYISNQIVQFNISGTARFYFSLDWSTTGKTGYARWQNVTTGQTYTERSFTGTVQQEFYEDIAFEIGQQFRIQVKWPGVSSGTFYVKLRKIMTTNSWFRTTYGD